MFTSVLLIPLVVAAPRPKDEQKPDPDPPIGAWAVQWVESEGSTIRSPSAVFWFTATSQTFELSGIEVGTRQARFHLTGEARHLDVRMTDSTQTQLGLWKVNGDTLTICQGEPGAARPTDFTAPKGSGRALWVLQRVKK